METGETDEQDDLTNKSQEQPEVDPVGPPLGALGRLVNVEALLFASGAAEAGDAEMGDLIDFIYDEEEIGNGGRLAVLETEVEGTESASAAFEEAGEEESSSSSSSPAEDGILRPLASLPSLDVVAGWDGFVQNLHLDVARATPEQTEEGQDEEQKEPEKAAKDAQEEEEERERQVGDGEMVGDRIMAEEGEVEVDDVEVEAQTVAGWPDVNDELSMTVRESSSAAIDLDGIFRDATGPVESFVSEASSILSPSAVRDLIVRAGSGILSLNAEDLMVTARSVSQWTGLDMREATELARATTGYAVDLARFANDVLVAGYVPSVAAVAAPKYETGDEDGATPKEAAALSPSSATNVTAAAAAAGTAAGPKATVRGFDATDDGVDRIRLLHKICDATSERIDVGGGINAVNG